MWNQGIAVYQTTLENKTYFMTGNFHDFTLIYLDNVLISTFNRTKAEKNNFTV